MKAPKGQRKEMFGTMETDDMEGTSEEEIIVGGLGDDYIRGGKGDDEIYGGDGWDEIRGGGGGDQIHGGPGSDMIYGGTGDDWIIGDGGIYWPTPDRIAAYDENKPGRSYVQGAWSDNSDTARVNMEPTELHYGDSIYGGPGNDWITGAYGHDYIHGGKGDDEIWDGGTGKDWIYGGKGNDLIIISSNEHDTYRTRPEDGRKPGPFEDNNRLNGGPGKDIFRFEEKAFANETELSVESIELESGLHFYGQPDKHIIEDFTQGEDTIEILFIKGMKDTDAFDISAIQISNKIILNEVRKETYHSNRPKFEELTITQGENGAEISNVGYMGLDTIVLLGVNAEDLTAADFGW